MTRPRTTSYSEEEMIQLGEEMVKWVELNNPLHLSEWYSIEKMIVYKTWKTFIQREEFIPYYEKALKIVAKNYLNGNVAPPIAQRFIRAYFKDVKDDENEKLEFESELRRKEKEADSTASQEAVDAAKTLMHYLSRSQSDRKQASTSINADTMSE